MVKKIKKEKSRSRKEKKKGKKVKKVQVARFAEAETLAELQERVDSILSSRKKPVKLARKLGELLTIRAGVLVHVTYIPGVEKQIIRGTLPWVRHFHTDSTEHSYMSVICFGDSALATSKTTKKLVLGLSNSEVINKNSGVRIK